MKSIINRKQRKKTYDYSTLGVLIFMMGTIFLIIFYFGFMLGHTKGMSDGKIEIMASMESGAVYCVMNNMDTYSLDHNFTIVCSGVYPK